MERRLAALAALLAPYPRVADIGAGSGQLARRLVADGHLVVATDLRSGAVRHLQEQLAGLGVDIRQGAGFMPLGPDEVDAACVAGLGGRTIAAMLVSDAPSTRVALVLQPMQDLAAVTARLRSLDRGVGAAQLAASRGRLYPILLCPPNCGWNGPADVRWDRLGWWLRHDPLWPRWVDTAVARLQRRHARLMNGPTEDRAAVLQDIRWLEAQRDVET